MSKIQEFANKLESEVDALKSQYEEKLAELDKKEIEIKARDAKSKSREIEVDLAAEKVAGRELEVDKKMKKIRSNEEMTIKLEEVYKMSEIADRNNREAKEALAQAKYREEEIAKKQMELQKEKQEYHERMKREFMDSLFTKILKNTQ